MIDFIHAEDDNVALVLVSHWIDNLYKLPEKYKNAKFFIAFCYNALTDGGFDLNNGDQWIRAKKIMDKALKKLYDENTTVDSVYNDDS